MSISAKEEYLRTLYSDSVPGLSVGKSSNRSDLARLKLPILA